MIDVLLDTVGLIALWDETDQWHDAADEAYLQIYSSVRQPVLTTTCVLLECGNAAARRPYRKEVVRLHRMLEKNKALIEPPKEIGARHGKNMSLAS